MKIRQADLQGPEGERMTTWLDVRPDLRVGSMITLQGIPDTDYLVVKLYKQVHEAAEFDWHRNWTNNI